MKNKSYWYYLKQQIKKDSTELLIVVGSVIVGIILVNLI